MDTRPLLTFKNLNDSQLKGKKAVVLGRSKIVGSPMAELLKWKDCTVTMCHSKTTNVKEICEQADVLVVAVRRPQVILIKRIA